MSLSLCLCNKYEHSLCLCLCLCLCLRYSVNQEVHVSNVVYVLFHLHAVEAADDESADTDGSGVGFKKIGTAIGEFCAKNCKLLLIFNFHNQFFDFSSKFLPALLLSDVTIKGNLLPQNSEEPAETCSELETYLAEKFEKPSSAESKKMRRELQEVYIVLLLFVYLFVCLFVCK